MELRVQVGVFIEEIPQNRLSEMSENARSGKSILGNARSRESILGKYRNGEFILGTLRVNSILGNIVCHFARKASQGTFLA